MAVLVRAVCPASGHGGLEALVSILERGDDGQFELSYSTPEGSVHLKVSAGAIGDLLAVNLTDIADLKEREASFRVLFDENPMPIPGNPTMMSVLTAISGYRQRGSARSQLEVPLAPGTNAVHPPSARGLDPDWSGKWMCSHTLSPLSAIASITVGA